MNASRYSLSPAGFFGLFISLHTLLWTVGPALTRLSLPHDTLESITWGLQWQLGYHKHPFLTAWLCAGVSQLFATVGWPVYLLAQLAVTVTFIAVWQLAKRLLPSWHALIATLLIEGVLFYNINSDNLTPDTMQSPLWALLSLFFYQALTTQKIWPWLLTALCAALSVCTKYQVVVLLLPMLFFCCINREARASFSKPGIYLAIFTFILLIGPHLWWLAHHHFISLTYAQQSAAYYTHEKTWFSHVQQPFVFLRNSLCNIIGVFILLWPF